MDSSTHTNVSFLSSAFWQIFPEPVHPMGAVGTERDASWHAGHIPPLPSHYHAFIRQTYHASINHQLRGQRHTPQCVISILCNFAKSGQNQPIQRMLWGLKGMHPDTQVVPQACQSTAMHPKGKLNTPSVIIRSMDTGTHHNALFLSSAFCKICPKPAHPIGTVWPEGDES